MVKITVNWVVQGVIDWANLYSSTEASNLPRVSGMFWGKSAGEFTTLWNQTLSGGLRIYFQSISAPIGIYADLVFEMELLRDEKPALTS